MLLSDRVLFLDGEALVIDKPAGLPVDAPRDGSLSIENHLDLLRFGFKRWPLPVHRLDRDTSGCLLLARNPKAHGRFTRAFENREVEKQYLAIIAGVPADDGGTIDLKLPAGVETGTQMRLAGKGQPGPGGHGDAIVTITVKDHPFFVRDGANIRLDLPVTLAEAVKGAKVKVPTVDGPVMLSIPAGSSSGKVMRLKGKGFSQKSGGRGDQLVRIMVDLPADDAALVKLLGEWNDPRNVRADLGV